MISTIDLSSLNVSGDPNGPPGPAMPGLPRQGARATGTQDTRGKLTVRLRYQTMAAHMAVERAAGLPERVGTRADYAACLNRFLLLVEPLEEELARSGEWESIGLDLAPRRRTGALRGDLRTLGIDPPPPPRAAPFKDFAAALGCLYVLEGSTLGGRLLSRAFRHCLGAEIDGATAFFDGHGDRAGPMWQQFRYAIDQFGDLHPDAHDAVVASASDTFHRFAIGLA
jgi:heme oxygenase